MHAGLSLNKIDWEYGIEFFFYDCRNCLAHFWVLKNQFEPVLILQLKARISFEK
jgi:hypothetical protein